MTEGQFPKTNGQIFYAREANMSYYQGVLSTDANNGAVNITTSPTAIRGVNPSRKKLLLRNNSTATIYIGEADVTTTTGIPISSGVCIVLNTTGVVYGIVTTGSSDLRFIEVN